MNNGWNYISFIARTYIPLSESRCGGAINVIKEQANVFVPDDIISIARLSGNYNLNKPFEPYLINNYTYYDYYFNLPILEENASLKFDESGIAIVKYEDGYHYNPVTVAQQALGYYNHYQRTGDDKSLSAFFNDSEWFIDNQEENGSFPYDFQFELKPGLVLPSGFVSGMAQGQILSTLVRSYNLTKDVRYLETGNKALSFMLASGEEDMFAGCSKTLNDFCKQNERLFRYSDSIIFEEYVSEPSSYVLNGDLFALIGLYDWSKGSISSYGKEEASEGFAHGIKSLEVLLPYYDYYGWSAYDLMQYTYGSAVHLENNYAHNCHIYCLNTLADVTGSDILQRYTDVFKDYVLDEFWRQTDVMYKED